MIVAVPAVVNVAVSCGRGTRTDHVAVDHVVPDCQLVVVPVVNVILEFPPQSPDPPVMADKSHEPAPAQVISCKSMLVRAVVPAEIVLAVPFVLEPINSLFIDEFPPSVNVPVVVQFPERVRVRVLLASVVKLPVYPVLVIDRAVAAVSIVQLLVLVEVKNTLSEAEGTLEPVVPPSVAAHELVLDQFPAPVGFQ